MEVGPAALLERVMFCRTCSMASTSLRPLRISAASALKGSLDAENAEVRRGPQRRFSIHQVENVREIVGPDDAAIQRFPTRIRQDPTQRRFVASHNYPGR